MIQIFMVQPYGYRLLMAGSRLDINYRLGEIYN